MGEEAEEEVAAWEALEAQDAVTVAVVEMAVDATVMGTVADMEEMMAVGLVAVKAVAKGVAATVGAATEAD